MPKPENVKFRVTADHIALLKDLRVRTAVLLPESGTQAPFEICPDIDKKRPFGNSGEYAYSVLEAIGREPDPETGYPDADKAYARQLLIELPLAYEAVMSHGAIEPCVEPLDRYKALFEYKGRRSLEYWRDAILDFSQTDPAYASRLVEFLMNANAETPMSPVNELASWATSCYWAQKALGALQRQAVRDLRDACPEHAGASDVSIVGGLVSGAYELRYGPSNIIFGADNVKGDGTDGES